MSRYAGLVLLLLFLTVVVISLGFGGGTPSPNRSSAAREPEPAVVLPDGKRIEWIEAKARCDVEARDFLVAPSTARFPLIGRPVLESNTWRHVVVVDAQNVFGAMIRSRFICVIDGDAGTIRVQVAD